MINELAQKIHDNAKAKGFYDDKKNIGEMLALIHSEVSEALEADRNNRYSNYEIEHIIDLPNSKVFKSKFEDLIKDSFEAELADIMIRVMDLAAYKGIDLEGYIEAGMRYNSLRPIKHGGKKY